MGLFGKKTNKVRADTADSYEPMTDDMLLSAILGQKKITREEAKKIPTVTACLDFIAGTLDSLPIRLYQKTEQGIEIVKDDVRVNLLNQDTGDTLTAKQFWRAILEDYYLGSGGYAYIERAGTKEAVPVEIKEVPSRRLNDIVSYQLKGNGSFDYSKNFDAKIMMCVEGIVSPNLRDAALQKHFECKSASELCEKLFGNEITDISDAISELSGISDNDEEEVKN